MFRYDGQSGGATPGPFPNPEVKSARVSVCTVLRKRTGTQARCQPLFHSISWPRGFSRPFCRTMVPPFIRDHLSVAVRNEILPDWTNADAYPTRPVRLILQIHMMLGARILVHIVGMRPNINEATGRASATTFAAVDAKIPI